MTTKQEIIDKILKVKALADRGNGGEKLNAQAFIEALMQKYDVTEDELEYQTELKLVWFRYSSKYPMSRKLLLQVSYSVVGADRNLYRPGKGNKIGVECTKAEAIEIEAKFGFYKALMNKELNYFLLAFFNKHSIFPPSKEDLIKDEEEAKKKRDEIDLEKLMSVMQGMDDASYRKQLR
ncbi:MAG: hypothetical protein WC102_03235 [Saccharofermentanales bacterium]